MQDNERSEKAAEMAAGRSGCDDSMPTSMLIGRCARMHMNIMRNTEQPGSIMAQNSCRAIIRTLMHEDGISQLELSRRTGLKPPTVSVALGKMEREGYICRQVNEHDGREVRVLLTDAGRELEADTQVRLRRADAAAMRDVTPEEEAELRRILFKIKKALDENENTSDPRMR